MKNWIGHTVRIEKDASITWRTPKGRKVGWGGPAGLADRLRDSQGKYKLDLSRTPLKLRNLVSSRELDDCYMLNRELSSLSQEEWNTLVLHPASGSYSQQLLLFDPEKVETRRDRLGFPVLALLLRTSGGSWGWVPTRITPNFAEALGL